MKPKSVTSTDNPLLKEYKKLQKNRRYREKKGMIAIEGPNLVLEAIKSGLQPAVVFYSAHYQNNKEDAVWLRDLPLTTKKILLTPSLFKHLTDTKSPQEVAAIIPHPGLVTKKQEKEVVTNYILMIDRLQDPGNLGSIIRTSVAAGVDKIVYSNGTVDPYSPKVLRSTAGSIFKIDLEETPDLVTYIRDLKEKSVQVVAASSGADCFHWAAEYRRPLALVIGNEAGGVAEEIKAEANLQVAIPMEGLVDSLNAAAAAAVLLFEIIRPNKRSLS